MIDWVLVELLEQTFKILFSVPAASFAFKNK
jgi:hypothetical protein